VTSGKQATLSEVMERKISRLWSSELDRNRVREVLAREVADSFGSERVALAILKLCGGDVEQVLSLAVEARLDYRDILMSAEYPGQGFAVISATKPGASDADRQQAEEAVQRDREQYEEWLKE
jgi:hypothetical protein